MNSLKNAKKDFVIIEEEEDNLLSIKKNGNIINIYDKNVLNKIIDNSFNKKYRNLLSLVLDIEEDDNSTDTDIELVLIKIENLKNYIFANYYKLIGTYRFNKYLKMLMALEEKVIQSKKEKTR